MSDADAARAAARHPGLRLPDGWRLRELHEVGPFVVRATFDRPDGTVASWTSRRHRKRLGLQVTGSPATPATPPTPATAGARRRPSRSSIAIGALFMIGSFCFAIGPLPAYADAVGYAADAWTFFVGSIFFTSAAYLQFHEALSAPEGPDPMADVPRGFRRFLAWAPHRIDWWACAIQFVGTLLFNVSTFAATRSDLALAAERRWIWAPDVFGSIAFLVSSWFAYVEVAGDGHGLRHRPLGWWIAALNLLGSVAFGVSAVAARYLPTTGAIANLPLANLGTFVGAVCFFVGAALLPVESARESVDDA